MVAQLTEVVSAEIINTIGTETVANIIKSG